MPAPGYQKYDLDLLKRLCDGVRTSDEIAAIVGCPPKYVQKQMVRFGLPRLNRGARFGELHRDWIGGRSVDLDGYALVATPDGHPNGRSIGRMLEHRLVAERKLGRYLRPEEVVDHIDGLQLHNDPSNLRVFQDNSAHLSATLAGRRPKWSETGKASQSVYKTRRKGLKYADTHRLRKARGDVRLRQILLAWLQFEPDSPHLLGTSHLLERIGIDPLSRPSLERAWADLSARWEADLLR